jgi:glutathione S-transferase
VSLGTLWTSTNSSGSISHLVASVSGLAIEPRFISLRRGEHRQPEYLAINPKGEVPALALADGTVITETPAILVWLADMAPAAGLLPLAHPQRAKALEWIAWCHFRMARDFSLAFQGERAAGGDAAVGQVVKQSGRERALAALGFAEARVQADDTLLGTGTPGAADIFLHALVAFGGFLKLELGGLPRLAALAAKVRAMPGVAAALAREAAVG